MSGAYAVLPPTSAGILRDEDRPYFLWWLDATAGDLRRGLADPDPQRQAYWLGALLREANSRDVWSFTTPEVIRKRWPLLQRHLGRTRSRWAWLLGLEDAVWPPPEARRA